MRFQNEHCEACIATKKQKKITKKENTRNPSFTFVGLKTLFFFARPTRKRALRVRRLLAPLPMTHILL